MIGTNLGHYEILTALGKGGMGEVWKARDTKLGREVAIKTLPEEFARDTDRLTRFEREAKLLASLNHPHIAAIYGLEQSGATRFLVLELVGGETLADRLERGPIPIRESLTLALQITEALEAAHTNGVIHRDLKPANIKMTTDGQVKILDFGLAKALASDPVGVNLTNSPTLSMAATRQGVILGTAAYMSPEQARGVEVDKSTDIWAFGCLLYEMLGGRQAFRGELMSDVMASVLKTEPDYHGLPADIHPGLLSILRRCLEKDRKRRYRDIGDVQLELEEVLQNPAPAPAVGSAGREARRTALPWALVAVLGLALVMLTAIALQRDAVPTASDIVRSSISLPSDRLLSVRSALAFSSDGRSLAFSAVGEGLPEICVRNLDSFTIRCLAETRGGTDPFFSPDDRRLGYTLGDDLWSISVEGESPVRLAASSGLGASWGRDGSIVFNPVYNQGLSRMGTPGEPATPLTMVDPDRGELGHFWPQILPDDNTVVFTIFNPNLAASEVAAVRIDTGEVTPLVSNAVFGRYLASGHLVFARSDNLMAVQFDPARLVVEGTPVAVLDDVFVSPVDGSAGVAMAENGTLAYVPRSVLNPDLDLVWVDANGNEEAVSGIRGPFRSPVLSPDGEAVLLLRLQTNPDIYLYELENSRGSRVTLGETTEASPVWMPDGNRLIFLSDQPPYDLYWQRTDRSQAEEALHNNTNDKVPTSVSPDGAFLVFNENAETTSGDIWLLPLDGEGGPRPFLQTQFDEGQGVVAPGGEWMAYVSDESGTREVYVQPFPEGGRPQPVSTNGGLEPHWAADGRTLYYRNGLAMMAVEIDPGPPLRIGTPETLFEKAVGTSPSFATSFLPGGSYDVSRDGRFLMVDFPPEAHPRQIDIIQNWTGELLGRVPVD